MQIWNQVLREAVGESNLYVLYGLTNDFGKLELNGISKKKNRRPQQNDNKFGIRANR